MWGVATSAFQLEGSPHADWANWDGIFRQVPDVTGHYYLYREDLALLKDLGVNAYRFSIEWSRIQPQEDRWDYDAIAHYQEVIDILLAAGIEPMLTIHHFTQPKWFTENHPWHEESAVGKFMQFAGRIVSSLRGVRYWITFNEPYVLVLAGYFEGCTPPGIRDVSLGVKALVNILIAHGRTYDMIHDSLPNALVSVAHNMAALSAWHRWNPLDRLLAKLAKRFYNHSLVEAFLTGVLTIQFPFRRESVYDVPVRGKLDFFGVNYYTRMHMRFNPLKTMGIEMRHRDIEGSGLTDMGWEVHPRGLEKVLRYAQKLNVPMIITENGIATNDCHKRIRYMQRHVDVVDRCIRQGMDIRGYFYWSLMDNYEWLQGLDAHFGLYSVDYATLRRRPTSAAAYYTYLIKSRSQK
ncbi:MAG: family 1 glycosylhydrolase [Nitrospiraceae bacterium]|nr:family 1 glycosylhydrolase [Nitrospiraceae bacterium]